MIIGYYTFEKWSENQADFYYWSLKFACSQIGEDFEIGKEYNGIIKKLLGYKSGKHIIFHQITNNEIEMIRILHERIDLKNRIKDSY